MSEPLWQTFARSAHILQLILVDGMSLESALAKLGNDIPADARPRTLVQLYSALRHLMLSKHVLDTFASRQPPHRVACLLYITLAGIVDEPQNAYRLSSQAVECVKRDKKHAALASFTNACLRFFVKNRDQILRDTQNNPIIHFNAPEWWIKAMMKRLGKVTAEKMFLSVRQKAPMILRVNRRKTTPDALIERFKQSQNPIIEATYLGQDAIMLHKGQQVSRLPGFNEGLFSVQDAGAQLACTFLNVQDGQHVLDVCAAPGGKTTHVLEHHDCNMTALEIDPVRAKRIEENLTRLGLSATVKVADGGQPDSWWDGQLYDRILLDAPCTASGIVRRHPDIVFLRRPQDIASLAQQQKRLLETVWPMLKPQGQLLYVVCSVFPEEGSKQIEQFLSTHVDAKLDPLLPSEATVTLLPIRETCERPGIPNEHDGFFYARLTKVS